MDVNNLVDAASKGSEALAKALSELTPEEWEQHWMMIDAAIVRSAPLSYEGYMAFARIMMYDPATQKIIEPAEHHKEWVRTCIEHNRVCILAPPESAKTTILSVLFTAYIVGKKPFSQSIVVSVSDKQAEDIAGTIAQYIEYHPGWKLCFPDIVPDKKRGWGLDKGFFVKRVGDYGDWLRERGTRKDPTLVGVGYGNRAIIGKRVDGVFIVDDMMDDSNTRSEAELAAAKSIFSKVISSRPTEDGKMILVGTPWREDDVYATAVSTGLYRNFITPAWTERGARKYSYWPDVWSIERLERKRKELGEKDFRLMYLMDLEASKGTILKEEYLEPFFPAERIDSAWPIYYGIDFAVTSWDYGLRGRGNKRSYFALAKVAHAPFGLVVVDGWRGQVSFAEAIEKIRSHAEADLPKKIQVEAWGGGEGFLQTLIKELPGENIFSYRSHKDKAARFSLAARHFEVGRVRISDAATQFLRIFKDEWIGFPSFPTNDCVDAVCNAIDATGFVVYSGESLVKKREKKVKKNRPQGWGGKAGIPTSRFAPRRSVRR